MNQELTKQVIKQHDEVIEEFEKRFKDGSFYHLGSYEKELLVTRGRSAIDRVARGSVYQKQIEDLISWKPYFSARPEGIMGILKALHSDLANGYLNTVVELVHGEVFGDFLDMASYLHKEGYKDDDAVISGSSLEAHLRQMWNKLSIPITDASEKPKKADRMNADLAGAEAYSKGDQKIITAWLDIRNNAAHGKYDEYTKEQVALMIDGIRDFINRNPA